MTKAAKAEWGYDKITQAIIDGLESATSPMEWPWVRAAKAGIPINAATGKAYSGINRMMLGLAILGGASRYWGTFNQWQTVGARIRKGEAAAGTVVGWFDTWIDPETNERVAPETPGSKKVKRARFSNVWHAGQVEDWKKAEGFDEAAALAAAQGAGNVDEIEAFIAATGAVIHEDGDSAFYRPGVDHIYMPTRDRFRDTDAGTATQHFYGTLLHELMHWTGHNKRLAREFAGRFGDKEYAFEELVAEIGSAFLCADLGISPEPRPDNMQYVASWLKVLKDDPKAIITAAAQSKKAAEFLHDFQVVACDPIEIEEVAEAA